MLCVLLLRDSQASATKSPGLLNILSDRSVAVPALAVALAAAGWGVLEPLLPVHLARLGETDAADIGLLFAAATIVYGASAPFVSWLTERIGVRWTIVLGMLGMAATLPLICVSDAFGFILLALCLVGVSFALLLNPTAAELGDAVERRGLRVLRRRLFRLQYRLLRGDARHGELRRRDRGASGFLPHAAAGQPPAPYVRAGDGARHATGARGHRVIQLAFLLLGGEAIRRHWVVLGAIGLAWLLLGVAIVTGAVENIHLYTMHVLGFLLVIEGCVTLLIRAVGHRSRLWQAKVLALIVPGLAIIETPLRNLMVVSILFGLALMVDSIVRTSSVLLLRFSGWRIALVGTAIEFVLALLALTPWPVTYEATVPFCVSVAMILSGWTVLRSAHQLRRLDPGAPVTSLPIFEQHRGWHASDPLPTAHPVADGRNG